MGRPSPADVMSAIRSPFLAVGITPITWIPHIHAQSDGTYGMPRALESLTGHHVEKCYEAIHFRPCDLQRARFRRRL